MTTGEPPFASDPASPTGGFALAPQQPLPPEGNGVFVIWFDDIRGSTVMKEEMSRTTDESAFQRVRKEHDDLVKEIIERDHAGQVIKSTGDGILAVFWRPSIAIERSAEIQEQCIATRTSASASEWTWERCASIPMGGNSWMSSVATWTGLLVPPNSQTAGTCVVREAFTWMRLAGSRKLGSRGRSTAGIGSSPASLRLRFSSRTTPTSLCR